MSTVGTVGTTRNEFYIYINTPVFQRKRTSACEKDALDMLKVYKKFKKVSEAEYETTRESILNAPHDDAISNIMCRLRHRINW